MPGWSPLLRRLLRIIVRIGIREVVRHGRRAAGEPREPDDPRPTVIDLRRTDTEPPFARYADTTRRTVAAAAEQQGGPHFGSEGLLLAIIDHHRPSAEHLARTGADLHALRSHLRESVDARPAGSGGPTLQARRALRRAVAHADRRGSRTVEPEDLLRALLSEDVGLKRVVQRYT